MSLAAELDVPQKPDLALASNTLELAEQASRKIRAYRLARELATSLTASRAQTNGHNGSDQSSVINLVTISEPLAAPQVEPLIETPVIYPVIPEESVPDQMLTPSKVKPKKTKKNRKKEPKYFRQPNPTGKISMQEAHAIWDAGQGIPLEKLPIEGYWWLEGDNYKIPRFGEEALGKDF